MSSDISVKIGDDRHDFRCPAGCPWDQAIQTEASRQYPTEDDGSVLFAEVTGDTFEKLFPVIFPVPTDTYYNEAAIADESAPDYWTVLGQVMTAVNAGEPVFVRAW